MDKTLYENIGAELYRATLPNGLTLLVLPRPGFRMAYAHIAVRYGSADRRFALGGAWTDTPAGVAHFLEHKMFDMPDGSNALAAFGAAGAQPNAFTSLDTTAYHFSCTQGFYDNLATLLRMVAQPYFTAESVSKEQGIIGQEICMGQDEPGYCLYFGLLSALYAAHPLRESIVGTVESIARITPETLYACHRAFYRPSNMVLACVGDVDAQRIADMAGELLGTQREEVPARDYGAAEAALAAASRWEKRMSVSAPQFYIGAKLPAAAAGEARMRQKLLAKLTLSFLVGESSPFYTKLYRDGLLNREFDWDVSYAAGTASLLLGGESRECEQVLAALRARLDAAAEQGFDEARWARCRKALYGGYLRLFNSIEALGGALAASYFDGGVLPETFALLPTLSAQEGAAFAAEAFAPERMALAVVRPGA